MKHQGLAAFALIVLISLLEAWQGRHWIAVAVWLGLGLFILAMDRPRKTPNVKAGQPSPR